MSNISSMYNVHSGTSTTLHPIFLSNSLCYSCYFYDSKCYFSNENVNINSVFIDFSTIFWSVDLYLSQNESYTYY